jgi:Wax ester synthase/diacylglycerol acyltransferase catalytic domain
VPRLRQRVREDASPLAAPTWELDPGFDLTYHLRQVRVPAPGTLDQVLAAVPSARPLWEAKLVERIGANEVELASDVDRALALAAQADVPITPVGVAWRPSEREASAASALPTCPGSGIRHIQAPGFRKRILDRSPARCRAIIGEPATRADLITRWERHSGGSPGADEFGRFVRLQAWRSVS